ncbi:tetraacyldisaccharide 4'-kinase [Mariprofundus ferrooxydans]|uniref:tetraacyldisaccharide 4'-kinase n=1 Tax=Mariprofundus ferrooxydans TaxID=314344 RepID=UPI00036ADF83|nr:tetraacyldisaccharide 4'-kinase [Mariprofundus ferrooxydans]
MANIHAWVERIWWSQARPPLLLRMLEPAYAAISRRHLSKRSRAVIKPPIPMISIGNITAGGSGKTPFALWLATELKAHGYQPVILCRGDGGKSGKAALVEALADANSVGDEACMLADLAPCPVIAAQDRVAGSHMAAGMGNLLILDDGFQYRHLGRCCDIVLVPAEGIGNGHQIPAGALREPVAALQRADIVVRTSNRMQTRIDPVWSRKEWRWQAKAGELIDIRNTGEPAPAQVYAATAIARPQRFFDDLASTGIALLSTQTWPDHYRFTKQDTAALLALNTPIAITAKDAVKLVRLWPADRPLWVLQQRAEAEEGLLDAIIRQIKHPER